MRDFSQAALAGAVLPFAFAPFGQFWIAPLSFAVLLYLWHDAPAWRAARIGFVYGGGAFGFGTYWTYIAVRIIGGAPLPVAGFLTIGLVAVCAAFIALAGYIAGRWFRARGAVAWLGVLPAMFVLTEWMRGWMFSGFGWLSAGYSQTDSWLMAYAPIAGMHAMSYAVLLTAGALVTLALGTNRERATAALVAVAVWGVGFAAHDHDFTRPEERDLNVALVQGAIEQDLKWKPDQLPGTLTLYGSLTQQSAGADLIVWPEAAIPTLYEYVGDYLKTLRTAMAKRGSTVLLGTLRLPPNASPETESFQNILVALTDPLQIYVKRHLVPFGEYFPVPGFIRNWMRYMNLPTGDAVSGAADQPPLDAAGERVAITICYEDVFGAEQLHYLPEATLLINVTNDAWFGNSIAPHQHLQIARVRAAEAGRYLLRAANTGITAVIDPLGYVTATVPQFETAVLKQTVRGYVGATPYARVRNYPVLALILLVLAAGYAAQRRSA
ncbi:MAG: apolipoprotein N-acyltransferase [Gammaproteobacteria bacterium]